ncbi:isocitrate lyase/PEP mutase family protein [Micromonospora parathelypteridis]|uniref:2-methylisocitrate lyase-like PEP mutase family enzyme n=1 Tax=Micromonospora parathelypteridis TaxID=1839617 RepID=A0A840W496_9ACTN|nr:isocitrate lyase/phosphoenolpyruvate mutase family protein [Micromonospora parathelypteridis]MBB5479928.1 2-methylisocitrate lyase-like PEP mutase family enzyme [Micromonospora parathelypteridis]GGO25837.1 2-methylisocitrate lyase [Micromonospora parathelypteridis]
MSEQHTRAELFRSLHTPGSPLVLVNAWDAASARIVADAGSRAVATTSAGVAWSLGVSDGDVLGRDAAVDLVGRVAASVSLPVTADIESGYGATTAEVGATIRAVIDAGAVGVNIEDARRDAGPSLRDVADQCGRIGAVRTAADEAGLPLYVNARIDTFLSGSGGVDETVARAVAYLAAGADGIFVPGVVDPATIRALVRAVPAPLNVLAGPGAPAVEELARLGVARVSLGSSVAEAAYAVARRAAEEALRVGTYGALADALDYGTLNALMR